MNEKQKTTWAWSHLLIYYYCIPNFQSYTDCNVTDSNSNPNCNTLHCCYPCTSLVYSDTDPLIHCVKLLSHCTKLLSQNYPTALKYSNTVLNYSHTALKYSHTAPPNYSQTALNTKILPDCAKLFTPKLHHQITTKLH